MEHRYLGNSGTPVSVLGLGTMTFGAETDEPGAHAQLDRFVEVGGTFIDTADVYSNGVSEGIIGSWLARSGKRDQVVLATKARFSMGDSPLETGAGRRHLRHSLQASLARLGVDEVDLYQVHGWDPHTPLDETLETLDGFVASGMVGHIGWSNVTAWQMQRIVDHCEMNGWARPVTLQPQYNLLDRGIELEVLPMCLEEEIGILPWSPLGGGWLTGKYSRDSRPSGETRLGEDPQRGVEAYDARNTDRTWRILAAMERIAVERAVPLAQVALAWVRQRPGVSSVILGARTLDQLDGNLMSAELTLSAEEMTTLTAISAPGIPPYPYGVVRSACGVAWWDALGTIGTERSLG
jgi:aryl-alcohol dehydrogenase-like predicted oxidoreductase